MSTQPQPQTILTHLIHLDKTWSQSLHALTTPIIPRSTLKLLELTGDGRLWFPLSISLLLSPLSLHSPSLYTASLSLLIGLITDIAVIGLIKHLVKRPRPVYNKSMGLTFSVDHWSFPSGHSSRVCFISAFCYLSTFDLIHGVDQLKIRKGEIVDRWIGEWESGFVVRVFVTVVCVWSVVTSISRVLFGRHFVFDVIVGATLGVVNSLLVYRFLSGYGARSLGHLQNALRTRKAKNITLLAFSGYFFVYFNIEVVEDCVYPSSGMFYKYRY